MLMRFVEAGLRAETSGDLLSFLSGKIKSPRHLGPRREYPPTGEPFTIEFPKGWNPLVKARAVAAITAFETRDEMAALMFGWLFLVDPKDTFESDPALGTGTVYRFH